MKKEAQLLRAEIDALLNQAEQIDAEQDAKIIKTSNKGFDYCFNAQAVVDEGFQIIVGADQTAICPHATLTRPAHFATVPRRC